MQEPELFNHYEIKNWEFNPRIYKILGISALVSLFSLLVVGQANLLTRKGCDSPFVGKVCVVLDTLYVGSKMATTNTEFIEKSDYEKTDLGDVEITWVNVQDKLYYPEGYFSLANPQPIAVMNPDGTMTTDGTGQYIPGITNPTTGGGGDALINTKPQKPQKNDNAVVGGNVDSPYAISENPTIKKNTPIYRPKFPKNPKTNNKSPEKLPNLTTDPTTDPKTAQTDPNQKPLTSDPEAIKINKVPLQDLRVAVNELKSKGEVNLASPFVIQAKGKLNKEGKIDANTFKYLRAESADKNMVEVVKESIEAFNDSGYLQYLTNLSGKDLEFLFQQDTTAVTAVVQSELESDTRAKSIASALQLLMLAAKSKKEGAIADMERENDPKKVQDLQDERDDLELLKNAQVASDGKKIVIKFVVPQEIATKMLERKLQETGKLENKTNLIERDPKDNQNSAK